MGRWWQIYSTLKEDLYVVFAGQSPDTQLPSHSRVSESAGEVDLLGGAVVVLGTLVALLPNRRAVLVAGGRARAVDGGPNSAAWAYAFGDHARRA